MYALLSIEPAGIRKEEYEDGDGLILMENESVSYYRLSVWRGQAIKKLISSLLVIQLVVPSFVFAEWETIEKEGKKFALVPSGVVIRLASDIQKLDELEKEVSSLKELVSTQEKQIDSLKKSLELYGIKENMYKMRNDIYEEQVDFLSQAYRSEVKENERLRIKRPSPLRWTLFGGLVTVGLVGLSAYVLKSIK